MKLQPILFLIVLTTSACALPTKTADTTEPEVMTIYPDGTMVFRNRVMNEDDVIIYSDGKGGEKAAVRVWEPLRPTSRKDSKYYRDTIIVDRVESGEVDSTE